MKFKIGAKISLGFACMIALVIILGGNSFLSLRSEKKNIESIDTASQRVLLQMQIDNNFKGGVAAIRGFIAYGDEKFYKQVEDFMNTTIEMEKQLLQVAREEKKQEVQNLINVTTQYKNGLINDLSPVVREYHKELHAGNGEKANSLFKQMDGIARGLVPMTEQISKTISVLVNENNEIVKGTLKSSREEADKVITTSVIVTLAAVIIGALLSVFLTRMISRPITAIVAGANQLAGGDFTGRMEINSSDEVGDLAAALQKMKDNFKEVLLAIKNSSNQLDESARQLASQAQQTSAGASETAATMGEVASTVENMSQNTQDVSRRAEAAAQHADKGRRGIEMVTGQMQEISAATAQVGASIEALSTAIAKIGQFVEVITNIADQTNLLALNAAIEAARAGEAGKGFAVVAEEVRKLAEQSAQSTKEIKQLIEEIEGQSQQAVQAMASGSEKVEQGNRIVAEVGQSFAEIIKAAQVLSEQVQNIAASAQQVSAGVQNVAGTTEEQTAAMEEVSAATEDLNRLVEELNSLVARFKV